MLQRNLECFWVVTETSVYHVGIDKHNYGVVTKVAILPEKDSSIPVGHVLQGGYIIAVGRVIFPFVPDAHGMVSPVSTFERNPLMVNTINWGQNTSGVVAMFTSEEAAMECGKAPCLLRSDPRWREQSEEVLRLIGHDHLCFVVMTDPRFSLFPDPAAVGATPAPVEA